MGNASKPEHVKVEGSLCIHPPLLFTVCVACVLQLVEIATVHYEPLCTSFSRTNSSASFGSLKFASCLFACSVSQVVNSFTAQNQTPHLSKGCPFSTHKLSPASLRLSSTGAFSRNNGCLCQRWKVVSVFYGECGVPGPWSEAF